MPESIYHSFLVYIKIMPEYSFQHKVLEIKVIDFFSSELKTLSSNYDCLYIHEKSEAAAKVSSAAAIDLADAVFSVQFRYARKSKH